MTDVLLGGVYTDSNKDVIVTNLSNNTVTVRRVEGYYNGTYLCEQKR